MLSRQLELEELNQTLAASINTARTLMVHDELTDATEHASFDHINDVWVVSTCTYAVVTDVYFVRRC